MSYKYSSSIEAYRAVLAQCQKTIDELRAEILPTRVKLPTMVLHIPSLVVSQATFSDGSAYSGQLGIEVAPTIRKPEDDLDMLRIVQKRLDNQSFHHAGFDIHYNYSGLSSTPIEEGVKFSLVYEIHVSPTVGEKFTHLS